MKTIEGITNEFRQKLFITITNYGYAELILQFKPNQLGWFYSLIWQDFSTYNQRLTMSGNVLRQYRNILPFGIMCINDDNVDPIVVEAFQTNTTLFLLEPEDVIRVETELYG